MNLVRRCVVGDHVRRSRLHDEKGNLIAFGNILHLPRALATCVAHRCFGYRPELPWLGYSAITRLQHIINRDAKILEFGSGMSTLWFAKRCRFLHSIESDEVWYHQMRSRLQKVAANNCTYELRSLENYAEPFEYEDEYFDFALIDGAVRSQCVKVALKKVRKGGHIYLDNTDKDMTIANGDMRIAEALLAEATRARRGRVEYFTDFGPTLASPVQGMLATI